MAKKELLSPQQIVDEIKKRNFRTVYFLQGDEPYYIDLITNALLENVVAESERDFNQTILYGADSNVGQVVGACRRYPMMSEYQLIVVKEAQHMDKLEDLEMYVRNPLQSTVLVINYKGKTFDSRKKVMKDIAANGGVIYESKKLYDDKVPAFVKTYVMSKGLGIDEKATMMISNFIGADLSRICGEIDKLGIVLQGQRTITPEIVERNIGISKDFNNFELLKAVINRDFYKINLICNSFAKDPKNHPSVVTIALLFNYFSNLMLAYYSPDKSEAGMAEHLGFKSTYQVRDYMAGMRIYPAFKTMEIITLLRMYDAKAKGFESGNIPDAELLKELLYKITH